MTTDPRPDAPGVAADRLADVVAHYEERLLAAASLARMQNVCIERITAENARLREESAADLAQARREARVAALAEAERAAQGQPGVYEGSASWRRGEATGRHRAARAIAALRSPAPQEDAPATGDGVRLTVGEVFLAVAGYVREREAWPSDGSFVKLTWLYGEDGKLSAVEVAQLPATGDASAAQGGDRG